MLQTVYHGSSVVVEKPQWGKGRSYNDYGAGFYLTKNKALAGEWAVFATGHDGYINEYLLDCAGLNVLNLGALPVENWIAVLMSNRRGEHRDEIHERISKFVSTYGFDTDMYDIIEGWRGDDSFFGYVRSFSLGFLSIEKLHEAMKLGDLGMQICLKSKRAFEAVEFVKSHQAQSDVYYKTAVEKDRTARRAFREMKNRDRGRNIFEILGNGQSHGRV